MIIVDSHEDKNRVMQLKSLGLPIEVKTIEVGDYLLPNDIIIESKLFSDFLGSLKSGRIWEQINNMYESEHPILAIVLTNKWKSMYFSRSNFVHNQYDGFRATLTISYPKLKLEIFEDDDEFVGWMKRIHKKLIEEGHSSRPIPKMRKGKKPHIIKENIIAQLPNVSVTKAKILLEKFGTIQNIANANKEDIESIEGFGKKISDNITKYMKE